METTYLLYFSREKLNLLYIIPLITPGVAAPWTSVSSLWEVVSWSCRIHPLQNLSALFSTQEWASRTTCFNSSEFSFPTLERRAWSLPQQRDGPLLREGMGEGWKRWEKVGDWQELMEQEEVFVTASMSRRQEEGMEKGFGRRTKASAWNFWLKMILHQLKHGS